ncbi:hypothetical protein Tco_1226199 [Tanacetum coccineum]
MTIKSRNQRIRIGVILDANNVEVTDMEDLFVNKVSEATGSNMVRVTSDNEIKVAMFNIGEDKSLGPDGFTSAFFKKGWDIIGKEVCDAGDFMLQCHL